MIRAEAAFRSRAARATVYGSVNGVVTHSRTSSLRVCFMTAKNTCKENSTAANDRDTSSDLPGHQLLISMTSGSPGVGGNLEAESGELVITITRLLSARSFAMSVMKPDV